MLDVMGIVSGVNGITGSNLQCHDCFVCRSCTIGYAAQYRHRPHVKREVEHFIEDGNSCPEFSVHSPHMEQRQRRALVVAIRLSQKQV